MTYIASGSPTPYRDQYWSSDDNDVIPDKPYLFNARPRDFINQYGKREAIPYLSSDQRIVVSIDIETWSPIDLKKAGLYNYAQKVEILLFAIHIPGRGTLVFDLTKEQLPLWIKRILLDPKYLKKAWNAPFEMACIESHFMIELDPDQWFCTMAQAAMTGLPLSLDQCGRVLNLEIRKDVGGMQCIRYFCMPCKPTKANGFRTRNLPHHNPELWNYFKKYVGRDVDSEMAIGEVVSFLPMQRREKILWNLDQKINRMGVRIDLQMAKNAIEMDQKYRNKVIAEAIKLTGVENPSSVKQIKKWLEVEEDIEIESLNKKHMPALLKKITGEKSKRVLEIRNELSKTSVRKYTTMVLCACEDERVKGIHQIYGAGRTLRFSGRLVQFQNIVKGKYHGATLKAIRDMIKAGDDEYMEMVFGAVPETLSNLIRTAIIPKDGCEFAVSDFSAIEARVLAWVAREEWRLEVFRTHGKIYEASASQMFKVPIESVTKSSDYRAKSKVAELALGYAGGVNALIKMGAIEMGLESDELQPLVDVWRAANPNIVALWKKFNYAAIRCVKTGFKTEVTKNIYFEMRNNFLLMWLPSGHPLCYYNPGLEETKFGHQVFYWGMDQTTKSWVKIRTYGGKLVENCFAAGTKIVTSEGLVNIENITPDMFLWDGVEWVNSGGVINKGLQETISLSGVRVTPDHKILTNEGWKNASSCDRYHRAKVQLPNGNQLCRIEREKIPLECSVRLWGGESNDGMRSEKITNKILRVLFEKNNVRNGENSWNEQTSCFFCLAFDVRPVPSTYTPSLSQLRSSWDICLRRMEKFFSILAGYGRRLRMGANFRQERCERELLQRELPLDNYEGAKQQQTEYGLSGNSLGQNECGGGGGQSGTEQNHSLLQNSSQGASASFILESGSREQVYDIINCGRRNRFTVIDANGIPFMAHNCTQGVARDCLVNALINIDRAGIDISMHVHDEIVAEVPIGKYKIDQINDLMIKKASWMTDLPLAAEGDMLSFYQKS